MDQKDIKVCLQFMRVWGLFKSTIERLAAENGLTMQQAAVLYRLYNGGSILMGTLARQLHCDASNITGMVDRLVAQGHVERQELPEDRRAKQLVLTAKGRQLVETMMPQLPKNVGIDRLSEDELDAFSRLLNKLEAQA